MRPLLAPGRCPTTLAMVSATVFSMLGACGAPEGDERVGVIRSAIRPTDGDGWFGNGYPMGSDVTSVPSKGGHFRIWYAQKGDQAPDLTDKDGDMVPDFVAAVAAAADRTYKSTIEERGFLPPLSDEKYNDGRGFGGDGRFDIYLRWAVKGSDGYRVIEKCTDAADPPAERCAGYFVMNPAYKDGHYPTEQDGIEVLTSHELFHAVQDAYSSGTVRTFSEGTAVWNELQVFPRDKTSGRRGAWGDYLGFLPALFKEPERPFDKSLGTGPGTSYAYATAAWFQFLTERHGPRLIRELWEGSTASPAGETPHFLEITETVLRERYRVELRDEWAEFTRWNLLTGPRAPADAARSYKDAAEYPQIRMEPAVTELGTPVSVELDGLSARYLSFKPALGGATRLRLGVSDPGPVPAVVTVYSRSGGGPLGPAAVVQGGALERMSQPGDELFAVVSSVQRGARAFQVTLTLEALASEPMGMPEPPPEEPGCSAGARRPAPGTWPVVALALALIGLRRARRVRS